MKPNGRRRWRKWLARERKGRMAPSGRGTEPWCWWASCDGTRVVRRHRGGEWVTGSLPDLATMPLPAREFSARSLCGMTQGARKRAARVEAISGDAATLALQSRKVWLLWWRQGCLGGMPKLAAYPSIRAKYRLGERLRPCPGCVECFVCLACENETCKREHHRTHICDGSGVLLAKRLA